MTPDPRLDEAKGLPIEDIADRLGIEGLRRNGREHEGPCPVCGGRDRFALNIDRGIFNCRICARGGDGIELVRFVKGCSFPDALAWLVGERDLDISPEEQARRRDRALASRREQEAKSAAYREQARRDGYAIWERAVPATGTPVEDYLRLRGVGIEGDLPPALRFLDDHPYVKKIGTELVTLHRGPAMIAAVVRPDGRFGAAHQTWIDLSQPKGKAVIEREGKSYASKMVRGSKKGGAIRLFNPPRATHLVMGEGIETTLTAFVASVMKEPAAFWAGVDLGNMSGRMRHVAWSRWSGEPDLDDVAAFVPPPGFEHLWLLQDGDSNEKMTQAKLRSCVKRAQHYRPGLRGHIVSAGKGKDLNDLVCGVSA